MNHHGTLRFCMHGQHMMPTEGFRFLPGLKIRREVCARCYAAILEARERVKIGGIPVDDLDDLPF